MHAEMPLASFLCAAFLFVPLRQFSKSADLPGIVLTAWLILLNVVGALNTIIWANSTDIIAEPWCDIVTKLIVGFHMALPSCCLCIAINAEHKYHPVQGRPLPQTALSRKVVQLSLCFLIPVIYMALHLVVQDHRFDILEDFGCVPDIYTSAPALLLLWLPSWVLCITTVVYCWLTFRHISHDQADSASQKSSAHSTGVRTLILILGTISWFTIASTFAFGFSTSSGFRPLPIPRELSRVDTFSSADVSQQSRSVAFFLWWSIPTISLFFIVFALPTINVASWTLPRRCKRNAGDLEANTTSWADKGKSVSLDRASSSASTIRFGPGSGDFFTIPNFRAIDTSVPRRGSEVSPISSVPSSAAPNTPTRDVPTTGSSAKPGLDHDVLSSFMDFGAPSILIDSLPTVTRHDSLSAHTALASSHNSFSTSRSPSVPSTVIAFDPLHISISSAREVEPFSPRDGFLAALPPSSPPASPRRAGQAEQVPMYQLELSAPPGWRAFGYSRQAGAAAGHGSTDAGSAIFMTVIS